MTIFRLSLAALLVVLAGFALADSAFAVTLTVNSLFDIVAGAPLDNGVCETALGNGVCTLRAAFMKANHFPGGGVTINVPAGTYVVSIPPVFPFDETAGTFQITQSTSITGAGMDTTFVDGGGIARALYVNGTQGASSIAVSISNLTVQNGNGGFGGGGGILYQGTLTLSPVLMLDHVHLTQNHGAIGAGIREIFGTAVISNSLIDENTWNDHGYGGGVANNSGTLTLNHSAVINNVTYENGTSNPDGNGGGIFSNGGGTFAGVVTLNDTTVTGNRATNGGGIQSGDGAFNSSLMLNRSTINANSAAKDGGGIQVDTHSVMTINNSTVSANSAGGNGGGIMNLGNTSLFHVTIAGNLANSIVTTGNGGGIYNSGGVSLWDSILAENFQANLSGQCGGAVPIVATNFNFVLDTCSISLSGTLLQGEDPLLGPLQDNGGATQTRALFTGSVVVDKVSAAMCRDSFGVAPTTDQRGVQRPVNVLCDLGAFEGSVPMPLLNANLIRNGDGEDGGASITGVFVGSPHWTVLAGQFTVVPYGAPGGFPVLTDTVPANHGYNFFAGGYADISAAKQVFTVTSLGAQIDAGQINFTLAGDFGGFGSQDDAATVYLYFMDGTGNAIGSPHSLGDVRAADRGNLTGLLHRSTSSQVPVGTRQIEVDLFMLRSGNSGYNDGYADNLSLVLGVATPPILNSVFSRKTHGSAGTFNLPLN